jgi:serine/threonine-protein kinase
MSIMGSVHYISPEQAKGIPSLPQSDIYSLGIVMFELLTGQVPFYGETAVSIALMHLQKEIPSPRRWNPEVSQAIENIVLKSTAKNPLNRYSSALVMQREIEKAMTGEEVVDKIIFANEEDTRVVDLDNTLINVLKVSDLPGNETPKIRARPSLDTGKVIKEQRRRRSPISLFVSLFMITVVALLFFWQSLFFLQPGRKYQTSILRSCL